MTATIPARRAARETTAGASVFAGTTVLARFILRRDRVRIPVWVAAIAGFTVVSVSALPGLYADAAERQARAELIRNPGLRAFTGPGYGLDDYTFGAMLAQEYLSWVAVFVALMSLLLVVRHTRAEEEALRAELVRSAPVGRHAPATAAVLVVGGASLAVGALIAVGLGAQDLEGVPWGSSWLFGAALASVGVVFAAVAAAAAQLSSYARGAGGLAGAALAAAYLTRAAGDMAAVGGGWPSWLSPIGWAQQTRVYVDDRWWPLLLSGALAGLMFAAALWLNDRHDVGAGIIRPRPGPARASTGLSSAWGLSWRLHRTAAGWWAAGLFVAAAGYGSLVGEVEGFVEELGAIQDWMAELGGETVIDSFLSVVVLLWAVAVGVFALLAALRLRSEESAGRAEPLLATAMAQARWVASHLVVALGGGAALLVLAGSGLGLTASAALGDWGTLPRLVGAALAYFPAVWFTVGVAVALFGLVPQATAASWAVVVYAALVGMFGEMLGLPRWTASLSPFGQVPMLPAEELRWAPLVVLSVLAAGLTALGLWAFRRRDLEAT